MIKCDFCVDRSTCASPGHEARLYECSRGDFYRYRPDPTTTPDQLTTLTRLIMEISKDYEPEKVARHLLSNGVTVIEEKKDQRDRPVYQDGDIYLNPCFGDLWVVDGASFVKINDGLRIDLDEPEDFIKVGHTTTRVRTQEK